MSKAKHTAGPWRAVIPAGYGKDTLIMSGTDIVASLIKFEGKAANARLIAASPELIEALKGLLSWSAHLPFAADDKVEFARDVIKTIEG